VHSSSLCIAEVASVFHRHIREDKLTVPAAGEQRASFLDDLQNEVWILLPITHGLLMRVESFIRSLPSEIPIRGADAIHLVSAMEHGFREIWTNDRHLLAAATHAGLRGRSVA